jgi:serine/threonine-protein kinase HipA
MNIANCPSCLAPGYKEFCPKCRKKLFNNKRVDPILPFSRPDYNRRKIEKKDHISISGVQTKHSLLLSENTLELTETGGNYILKPIPLAEFNNLDFMPANEHVTMQIARQVFKLNTADCALVFFSDTTPAYLTKRFDVLPNGKNQQEDFAQIAQATEENNGKNYKYDFSYEEIAALMQQHISAYAVDVEEFFRILVFNFLVNNGDAHLKNFSLYRDPILKTYRLTPAYDLLNTALHINDDEGTLALELFGGDYTTTSFDKNGFYAYDDFAEFGARIGINPLRVERIITSFSGHENDIAALLKRSFLSKPLQERYIALVQKRMKAITYSYKQTQQ